METSKSQHPQVTNLPDNQATLELDLRDLAPPEPMIRILEGLERLPADAALVARTPFYPENLLPLVEERGFRWEAERESGTTCRLRIFRA